MAQGRLHEFLSKLGPADLSSLIVLRVILRHASDSGRLARSELIQGIREEYERLSDVPGFAKGGSLVPEITARPEEETLRYLDEHVLQRFVAEGIIERRLVADTEADAETDPPEHELPDWAGIRLTPVIRAELLEAQIDGDQQPLIVDVDQRIGELLDEQHTPAVASPLGRNAADGNGASVARPGSTLAAKGLVKVYRKRRVVNEVDVRVSQGEIVGLLGPNGAGKTTTFYMMVGLIEPDRGRVYLSRDELTGVPMYKRARLGIGYLAQEPSVFRKLTVEENILAVLQMLGISRREQRERLEKLLDELGIKHLRATKAYALSGGERRRLEITRALVGNPKFMLLDEPFAGVDPIAVHDIQQIVADLRRRHIGVLISDHNVEQTLDIVDRAYIMYDGRVRVSGTVSELVWNDEVAEIYLGPTLTARMRQRYTQPEGGAGE